MCNSLSRLAAAASVPSNLVLVVALTAFSLAAFGAAASFSASRIFSAPAASFDLFDLLLMAVITYGVGSLCPQDRAGLRFGWLAGPSPGPRPTNGLIRCAESTDAGDSGRVLCSPSRFAA